MITRVAWLLVVVLTGCVTVPASKEQEALLQYLRQSMAYGTTTPNRFFPHKPENIHALKGMERNQIVKALGRPSSCKADASEECEAAKLSYNFFSEHRAVGSVLVFELSPAGHVTDVLWQEYP